MDEFEDSAAIFAVLRQNGPHDSGLGAVRQIQNFSRRIVEHLVPVPFDWSDLQALVNLDFDARREPNLSEREKGAVAVVYWCECWIQRTDLRTLDIAFRIAHNHARLSRSLAKGRKRQEIEREGSARLNQRRSHDAEMRNLRYAEIGREVIREKGHPPTSKSDLARNIIRRCGDYASAFPQHASTMKHPTPGELAKLLPKILPEHYGDLAKNSSGNTLKPEP